MEALTARQETNQPNPPPAVLVVWGWGGAPLWEQRGCWELWACWVALPQSGLSRGDPGVGSQRVKAQLCPPVLSGQAQGDTEGALGGALSFGCAQDPAPGSSPGSGWGGGWSTLPTGSGEWPSAGRWPPAGARVTDLSWGVCRWLCREQELAQRPARAPPALPVSTLGPSHAFRLSPVLWVSLDCCFLKKQKILFFTESKLFSYFCIIFQM